MSDRTKIQPNRATLIMSLLVLACTMFAGSAALAWSPTGDMTTPRVYHRAARLPDGKVLVAGGISTDFVGSALSSAEIYDPTTGSWTKTGSMATARKEFSLTLLPNGKVLAAGGSDGSSALCSAELYDPATGAWTPTGATHDCHWVPSAVLLTNGPLSGRVLIAGGHRLRITQPSRVRSFMIRRLANGRRQAACR